MTKEEIIDKFRGIETQVGNFHMLFSEEYFKLESNRYYSGTCKEIFTKYFYGKYKCSQMIEYFDSCETILILDEKRIKKLLEFWKEFDLPSIDDYLGEIDEYKVLVFDNKGIFKFPIYTEILFIFKRVLMQEGFFDRGLNEGLDLINKGDLVGVCQLMKALKSLNKTQREEIDYTMAINPEWRYVRFGFVSRFNESNSKFSQFLKKCQEIT